MIRSGQALLQRNCDGLRCMKTAPIPIRACGPGVPRGGRGCAGRRRDIVGVRRSVGAGSVEHRRLQAEFVARRLRSREESRRTGKYVDADVVVDAL